MCVCCPIYEPSKGNPCLFCHGAKSGALCQSALPTVRPLCGLLPAGRKRRCFFKESFWRCLSKEFASPRPPLTWPPLGSVSCEQQVEERVPAEHGFSSARRGWMGFPRGCPGPERKYLQKLFVCCHVAEICLKESLGPWLLPPAFLKQVQNEAPLRVSWVCSLSCHSYSWSSNERFCWGRPT